MIYWAFLAFAVTMIALNFLLAPLLLLFWRGEEPQASTNAPASLTFSIIVPAYNEEESIEAKIETLRLALKSVNAQCEILIGSDGSKDATVAFARAKLATFESTNWKIHEFVNEGKCATLNKLVAMCSGDIVISTDADIPLPANSIIEIADAFTAHPKLGCISCIPCFAGSDIGSQKAYWNIEDDIRRAESGVGRLIVVTGMLYAYRKELFKEIPCGVMADDLWVPLNVLIRGYQSRQLDRLRVPYEKTDEAMEIVRRKRVMTGGIDVVRRLLPRLRAVPATFTLVILHKVNRWALPLWLGIGIVSSVLVFPPLIAGYLGCLLLLFLLVGKERFSQLLYAAISPLLSYMDVIRKNDFSRWEHTRKL